jgi:hypothetical protein
MLLVVGLKKAHVLYPMNHVFPHPLRYCSFRTLFLFSPEVKPLIDLGDGLVVEDDPQKTYILLEFKCPSIKSKRSAPCRKHLDLQPLVPEYASQMI